jgi:periplasmic protein TonB
MFEYVNSQTQTQNTGHRALTTIVSVVVHLVVLLLVFLIPIMYFTPVLPASLEMLAFVAAAPPPPPPPPPPPARAPSRPQTPRPNPTPMPGRETAPVEAPQSIEPEAPPVPGIDAGLLGGVEGGVEGGVVGGIVGGLVSAAPPPPPPAPTAAPVRVGGQIKAPALISRVEPVYPTLAQAAQVEGVVILEATVDEAGCVSSVRVLRSAGLLDNAAVEAVKQWRYSALRLNGHPQSFVLTVTVAFHLG